MIIIGVTIVLVVMVFGIASVWLMLERMDRHDR